MMRNYPNFRRAQRHKQTRSFSGLYWAALTALPTLAFGLVFFWPMGAAQSASGPPDDATINCAVQWVHDGDTLRCVGYHQSTRLHAIDAPEMPGACHPGRECTPGNPYASRDHLRSLVANRQVMCRQIETDHYGRPVMDCWAGNTNLSCAMVKAGHAVERYGRLQWCK